MKSRAAHVEENRIIGQEINNSETENPVFGCGSRSFRLSPMVRNTLLVGLLGGNSRSFTLIFMAAFSVLLFCFDRGTVKHSVIQHVGYSCDIWRYTRAQSTLLRNLPKFWRFKKRICHKKGPKNNKLTFCLFLAFTCAKVIKIIQLIRSSAIFLCKMLVELWKVCNLDKKPTQKGIYIHNGKKVCHNLRGYGNGAFASLATDGKGTMGCGVTDTSKNKQSQET